MDEMIREELIGKVKEKLNDDGLGLIKYEIRLEGEGLRMTAGKTELFKMLESDMDFTVVREVMEEMKNTMVKLGDEITKAIDEYEVKEESENV